MSAGASGTGGCRPNDSVDDEQYLSLDDLAANVQGRYARSRSRVLQTGDIRVEAVRDGPAGCS
tara:strand:- start:8763 stop:8951 length:189 start_codon:yes stop_codon:yes gene_type:complete